MIDLMQIDPSVTPFWRQAGTMAPDDLAQGKNFLDICHSILVGGVLPFSLVTSAQGISKCGGCGHEHSGQVGMCGEEIPWYEAADGDGLSFN